MSISYRKVKLPASDTTIIEKEEIILGSSETQLYYTYYTSIDGCPVDTSKYTKDYWGRVENLTII